MANRLTQITTRAGDDGNTSLGDGTRVPKHNARIEVLGEVDELNSALGTVLAETLTDSVRETLKTIQHDLFDLGSELCIPGREMLQAAHLSRLDALITQLNGSLPALQEFILPGGCRAAALCHVARATCRRAERRLTALMEQEPVSELSEQYLNRLSDLLFVLCRIINRDAGAADSLWKPGHNVR
jgi:cob(I)alamin adenosyltransferase